MKEEKKGEREIEKKMKKGTAKSERNNTSCNDRILSLAAEEVEDSVAELDSASSVATPWDVFSLLSFLIYGSLLCRKAGKI